ncbi:9248_t:CDS:1, partial [Dentiscutata heterogama]
NICDNSADAYGSKDDFSHLDIHETQWMTNVGESRHQEDLINVVDKSPFVDVLEDMFD